jgi:thioredoxin reductase
VEFDVIIVGAGPAGLSAALILGRCRRRVLVLDTNRPRNYASRALHGFLTRDGVHPQTLRRLGRDQLRQYDTVTLTMTEAIGACCLPGGFEVTLHGGRRMRCRKLLLATGVHDELPALPGLDDLYGRSVFHCPYCDGWESRDRRLVVYSRSQNGVGLAIQLQQWSQDVVLCTDGVCLPGKQIERLRTRGIRWYPQRIARLEGTKGQLRRVVFADGDAIARSVMFFSTPQRQASVLPSQLGCTLTRKGAVRTGEYEASEIPGLYVAGDASKAVQLAIIAAAEGAHAAFAINSDLIREDAGPERRAARPASRSRVGKTVAADAARTRAASARRQGQGR